MLSLILVPDLGTYYLVPNMGAMTRSLHSMQYQKLTVWLKSEREAAGLSMRALSERLGTPHSYVGKIEQQERRLDVVEYFHYCKALNVSPQEGLKIIEKVKA